MSIIAALIEMGAPSEVVEAARLRIGIDDDAESDTDVFDVYPVNWEAVIFFGSITTQFVVLAGPERPRYIGLN